MEKEKELVLSNNEPDSMYFDVALFEHSQRVAKLLSSSTMIPDHFKGPENIGNCVIALNYAKRLKTDPFIVMQKMYIIHGKPAIESKLQISLFNTSGRFSPLKYKFSGEKDSRTCVAYAQDLTTKEILDGPPVSIAMAKSQGWYSKNGSKWPALPDLMLMYRSATFFIGVYAPETTLGLYTKEEVYDSGDIIDLHPEETKQILANTEVIDIESEPISEITEKKPQTISPLASKSNAAPSPEEQSEIRAREMKEAELFASRPDPGF